MPVPETLWSESTQIRVAGPDLQQLDNINHQKSFHHAAVTKPLVHDLTVMEVSSPTARMVLVHSYNSLLDQKSREVVV